MDDDEPQLLPDFLVRPAMTLWLEIAAAATITAVAGFFVGYLVGAGVA